MTWMKAIAILGFGGAVASIGGLTAVGCSSTPDEETIPVDPYATEPGFCTELAKRVCSTDVVKECYGSADSSLVEDTESCNENALAKFCNDTNAKYRPANAEVCLTAYQTAYADAELTSEEFEAIDVACHPTLSGTSDIDDVCELDSDCDGSAELRCVIKLGSVGTCQVPKEVGPGLQCDSADTVCEDDFFCSDGACIVKRSVGQVCGAEVPCANDAICDLTEMSCSAKQGNGTMCDNAEQCLGGFCDKPDGSVGGTCKASLPVNSTNGECVQFTP